MTVLIINLLFYFLLVQSPEYENMGTVNKHGIKHQDRVPSHVAVVLVEPSTAYILKHGIEFDLEKCFNCLILSSKTVWSSSYNIFLKRFDIFISKFCILGMHLS